MWTSFQLYASRILDEVETLHTVLITVLARQTVELGYIGAASLMSMLPLQLRSQRYQRWRAEQEAVAEAPLPPEVAEQFEALAHWIRTNRVPEGWRLVGPDYLTLERTPAEVVCLARRAHPNLVVRLLRAA